MSLGRCMWGCSVFAPVRRPLPVQAVPESCWPSVRTDSHVRKWSVVNWLVNISRLLEGKERFAEIVAKDLIIVFIHNPKKNWGTILCWQSTATLENVARWTNWGRFRRAEPWGRKAGVFGGELVVSNNNFIHIFPKKSKEIWLIKKNQKNIIQKAYQKVISRNFLNYKRINFSSFRPMYISRKRLQNEIPWERLDSKTGGFFHKKNAWIHSQKTVLNYLGIFPSSALIWKSANTPHIIFMWWQEATS